MSTANTVEREMLALINQERTSRGLNPLQLETQLNASSEDHSAWMLNTDRFSHTGAGGSSATQRMEAAGFDFDGSWRSGENIAWQSERGAPGISDDVAQLHQNLMNSPGHRANILNPEFKYIGIGVETGDMQGFDAVMVTQNFATTDGTVSLDTGTAAAPAPTPPVAEAPAPDQPVAETPDTDVTEAPDPAPGTDVPGTVDPNPEVPDTDVTETEDPTPETPATDVTETDNPDTETPDTDVTDTEDPATEVPDTDVTDVDDPEPDMPDTDVTETDDPVTETPDTDVTEADDPAPDMPDTEVTDNDDLDDECFDVAAFLAEIEAFVEALQSRLDQFAWNNDPMEPSDSVDEFELVMDDDFAPDEEEAPMSDVSCDDDFDVLQFNFFSFDCMMDAA